MFKKLRLVVSKPNWVSPSFNLLNSSLDLAFLSFDCLYHASIQYEQALKLIVAQLRLVNLDLDQDCSNVLY